MPRRSAPIADAAASASSHAAGDGSIGTRVAPSATFVRHSPRLRNALDRSDHLAARNDDAHVVTEQRHELLRDRAGRREPRARAQHAERPLVRALVCAEEDVTAPASVPRLDDEGKAQRRPAVAVEKSLRPRMRKSGRGERRRRGELVVGARSAGGGFSTVSPRLFEQLEMREPRLDSVERRTYVEAAECGVARLELQRLLGRAQKTSDAPRRRGREAEVRLRRAVRDYGDSHAVTVRPRRPLRGVGAVNEW